MYWDFLSIAAAKVPGRLVVANFDQYSWPHRDAVPEGRRADLSARIRLGLDLAMTTRRTKVRGKIFALIQMAVQSIRKESNPVQEQGTMHVDYDKKVTERCL